ncbi:Alpha/Beta hydrolase protein [Cerioporus squamosus]|nr:Alpha/Beta hydrolase protein [Cerioporus squamosus]
MNIDLEIAAALAATSALTNPTPPPDGVSEVEHARQELVEPNAAYTKFYAQKLPEDAEGSLYVVDDRRVPVEGGDILVRVVKPVSAEASSFPVLVWYHGGVGDVSMDDYHLRTVAVELQLVVVNVEYRLAPEHPFPTAFNDSYAALKWVVHNAADLSVDLKKGFLVGGESAGASLAAGLALKARDDPFFHGNDITGQWLQEPIVCHPDAYPEQYKADFRAFGENSGTPLLSSELARLLLDMYGAPPSDLGTYPLLAPSHAGLPPAFIQVQEVDPLHDDGIVYEKALRAAGVKTQLVQNRGTLHGFHYYFFDTAVAQKQDRDAREGLRWLLSLRQTS